MIIQKVNWENFKNFLQTRKVDPILIGDSNEKYWLVASCDSVSFECDVLKNNTEEVQDYEENWKTISLRRSTLRTSAFNDNESHRFRGVGLIETVTSESSTEILHQLTEDRKIDGAQLILKDHNWNDSIDFVVIDKDNLFGLGEGVVLDKFAEDWNISTDKQDQGVFKVPYIAHIPAGLYIGLIYHSAGTVDVSVKVNLLLHKKDE
jgi:hypothetical protein